jgi:hypothetical protein
MHNPIVYDLLNRDGDVVRQVAIENLHLLIELLPQNVLPEE